MSRASYQLENFSFGQLIQELYAIDFLKTILHILQLRILPELDHIPFLIMVANCQLLGSSTIDKRYNRLGSTYFNGIGDGSGVIGW